MVHSAEPTSAMTTSPKRLLSICSTFTANLPNCTDLPAWALKAFHRFPVIPDHHRQGGRPSPLALFPDRLKIYRDMRLVAASFNSPSSLGKIIGTPLGRMTGMVFMKFASNLLFGFPQAACTVYSAAFILNFHKMLSFPPQYVIFCISYPSKEIVWPV